MAVETEKKYRLTKEQYDEVLDSLKDVDGQFIKDEFEINMLYGGGILTQEKAILRVRKIDDKTILTYKKQIHNNLGVKQHTEFETEVADSAEIENIIGALGFKLKMVYEKRRQTWHLQNVEVCLDELPFGLFMEVEGKMSEIGLIEMLLDLDRLEVEHETYPKLTFQFASEKKGVIEAKFPQNS